jgi:hypothetical protein
MIETFKNHHQPFLFQLDGDVELITSKILEDSYKILWGSSISYENCWKLYHISLEVAEETEIKTPKYFEISGVQYIVIAECNGYIYKTSDNVHHITYVATLHSTIQNTPPKFVLVDALYNPESLETTENVIIPNLKFHRTAIKNNDKIVVIYDDKILINGTTIKDLSSEFTEIVRIMGVWNKPDQYLVTGKFDGCHKTICYNAVLGEIRPLKNLDEENVYKSSVLDTSDSYILAWTDKVFKDSSKSDYFLNVSKTTPI